MSNIVLLIVVVLACFSTESAAQVHCLDPIAIGELRVLNSKLCVDIYGVEGRGKVTTAKCDGHSDQQFIICGDGTIRNMASPHYCVTPDGNDGKGYLASEPCQVYPAIPDYQKWTRAASRHLVDNGGIEQEARIYSNRKSGECMDVMGHEGNRDIVTYIYEDMDDQYFYIRSRGGMLAHGRLQVEVSDLCLDVSETEGRGNVYIGNCENSDDQFFSFHENGELVNKKSGLCVDVEGYDGTGLVSMDACEDKPDQMWRQPQQYCLGDYCAFSNKKSGQCLNAVGHHALLGSDVITYPCETAPDERFRWVTEKWVTPTATWSLVGCNQNGKVTHEITNSVSYTETVSASLTIEISATIEADFVFGSASVTTSMSSTLAKEWEESQSGSKAITFTCEIYDTGSPFINGCMWQLQLTTKKTTNDVLLTWLPQIVKCTSSTAEPTCPPFTKCKDDACTMCEDMPGARKKRSVNESLTWKKVLKID